MVMHDVVVQGAMCLTPSPSTRPSDKGPPVMYGHVVRSQGFVAVGLASYLECKGEYLVVSKA